MIDGFRFAYMIFLTMSGITLGATISQTIHELNNQNHIEAIVGIIVIGFLLYVISILYHVLGIRLPEWIHKRRLHHKTISFLGLSFPFFVVVCTVIGSNAVYMYHGIMSDENNTINTILYLLIIILASFVAKNNFKKIYYGTYLEHDREMK